MSESLERLRVDLRPHAAAVRDAAARTAAGVRELGAALRGAKAACRHGEWLPFLAAAGIGERFAQRAMRYARLLESDNLSDLPAPARLLTERAERRQTEAQPAGGVEEGVERQYWGVGLAVHMFLLDGNGRAMRWRYWCGADTGYVAVGIAADSALRYWTRNRTTAAWLDGRWPAVEALLELWRGAGAAYRGGNGETARRYLGSLDHGLKALVRADPCAGDGWVLRDSARRLRAASGVERGEGEVGR